MRLRRHLEEKPAKRRKAAPKKPLWQNIAAHKAFVPIVVVWGAALLGLIVMVLPQGMIEGIGALTGGMVSGTVLRIILAVIAAVLGGGIGLAVSASLKSATRKTGTARDSYSVYNAARPRPIDPASELGSESLDAPLEDGQYEEAEQADGEESQDAVSKATEPTLGELAQRGFEIDDPEEAERKGDWAFTHGQYKQALIECCEGASCEAAPAEETLKSPLVAKPERDLDETKPRALDLGEFAQLDGRNGVWVEHAKPAPEQAPTPITAAQEESAQTRKPVPENALEKLRQKPTEELSLVEMVERFAGALHQHQQSERANAMAGGKSAAASRDSALAEALKALTLFTESGFDTGEQDRQTGQLGQTERELRDALAKLQTLRGAA